MPGIVAYYRVSTKDQEDSGLGLKAQFDAVKLYAERSGELILRQHTETESGTYDERPELDKALNYAKGVGATLVVARLDRLARSVYFVSSLMKSGVEFACVDMPVANRFTIHVLAAAAEYESELVSVRTKAALQRAKEAGVLLGTARPGWWDGKDKQKFIKRAAAASALASIKRSIEHFGDAIIRRIVRAHNRGVSMSQIAKSLNLEGYVTRKGKQWRTGQVSRILERLKIEDVT